MRHLKTLIMIAAIISANQLLFAQDVERQLIVPLSNPEESGLLKIDQVNGSIQVEAFDGKEVIIDALIRETSRRSNERRNSEKTPPPGMKRINSNPAQITARENNNEVEVNSESWKRRIDLSVKVPADFDLQLHTVHGEIEVRNVNGEMEISGVNGGIRLEEISGSVVSNTVNGEINVRFGTVTPEVPMSFVTLNGNVDVTIPGNTKMLAKMKSERGEIFSDFDMDIMTSEPQIKRGEDCDCEYEISLNSWTFGKINGGSTEFTFKNMNGDILIRKR